MTTLPITALPVPLVPDVDATGAQQPTLGFGALMSTALNQTGTPAGLLGVATGLPSGPVAATVPTPTTPAPAAEQRPPLPAAPAGASAGTSTPPAAATWTVAAAAGDGVPVPTTLARGTGKTAGKGPSTGKDAAKAADADPTDDDDVDETAAPTAATTVVAALVAPVPPAPRPQPVATTEAGSAQAAGSRTGSTTGSMSGSMSGTVAVGTDVAPTGARSDTQVDHVEAADTVASSTPAGTATAAPAPVPVAVATATPTSGTTPAAVAAQVVPEVTRLVSSGDGVHRVTLELNPRSLGEVRVVLTVRQGDVHVRLAAGSEARAALAATSGDLTRALAQVGVKGHGLTLAGLSGAAADTTVVTTTSAATAGTATGGDPSASRQQTTGAFDGSGDQTSQPRTGGDRQATDGTDQHASRSGGGRVIHEVAPVPLRGGVDLRM